MLPKNKLSVAKLGRLKVYSGNEHDHSAQLPKEIKLSGVKTVSKAETN